MNIPKVSRCGCSGLALAGELLMVSRTHSKKLGAGGPAVLKPASREMISDSALRWNTVVCSLHIYEGDKKVCEPEMHTIPPHVGFKSTKSPVHEAS